MKVCKVCGEEIFTPDGVNTCPACQKKVYKKRAKARRELRRLRDQAMRDIGLVKVRGAMGGTYWE
jgi:uncharacterized Zn finger protein (UPF0148 family)